MNTELLKLGVEVLPGWEWAESEADGGWLITDALGGVWRACDMLAHAIPAYMAEALKEHYWSDEMTDARLSADFSYRIALENLTPNGIYATPQERIAAALVALGVITVEQAWELLK